MEPFSEYIRRDNSIPGVKLPELNDRVVIYHKVKLCQYADDASIILQQKDDILRCIHVLNEFGKASGARLNVNKTIFLCFKNSVIDEQFGDIKLSLGPETVLGVPQGVFLDIETFWENKLTKMKNNFSIW
jgi:hypothetical protein